MAPAGKLFRLLSDENLKTGQKVSIITDPDKPERAFIGSVFTD